MKKILPVALLFVSVSSVAVEHSYSKSITPRPMAMPIFGTVSMMSPLYAELKDKGAGFSPKITSVEWASAYYPGSVNETAHLCYVDYSRVGERCEEIAPGGVGVARQFNNLRFYNTTIISIKHFRHGGPVNAAAVGQDQVVVHYTY